MSTASPSGSILLRRFLPLALLLAAGAAAFWAVGRGWLSLESLIRHRAEIDALVRDHAVAAVLGFVGIYIGTVALSIPGATFLTLTGGFLFGLWVGTAASVVGATIGATVIFLVARTALGEPLLAWAGPRAAELARGFRADAFSYLLFLRLVPAFPFFLVNLVPAVAGVRLGPFVAATALGVIPASIVYSLAGTTLDGVIAAQQKAHAECLASGTGGCRLAFDARDALTPQFIAALVGLGVLALLPVLLKRVRARRARTNDLG